MTQERKDLIRDSMLSDYYYVVDIVTNRTKYKFPNNYEDELRSYLSVEYVQAYKNWDEEKSSWPTYVTNVLLTRATAHLKYLLRQRRVSPWIVDSFDMEVNVDSEEGEPMFLHDIVEDPNSLNYGDDVESEDLIVSLLGHIRDDKFFGIALDIIIGTHYTDIIKKYEISTKTFYRYKERLREHLLPLYTKLGGRL